VISVVLPASAIMYASGQPGCCEPAQIPQKLQSTSGSTGDNTTSTSGSTGDNTTSLFLSSIYQFKFS